MARPSSPHHVWYCVEENAKVNWQADGLPFSHAETGRLVGAASRCAVYSVFPIIFGKHASGCSLVCARASYATVVHVVLCRKNQHDSVTRRHAVWHLGIMLVECV